MGNNNSRGWSFPVRLNPLTGSIETTKTLKQDVKESLFILLGTMLSERIYHQDYGSDLKKFMFEPISYSLIKNVEDEIRNSIKKWEKRVSDVSVEVFNSKDADTTLIINIRYVINEIQEAEAIVYTLDLLENE